MHYEQTQHGFLMVWGWFAAHIGLPVSNTAGTFREQLSIICQTKSVRCIKSHWPVCKAQPTDGCGCRSLIIRAIPCLPPNLKRRCRPQTVGGVLDVPLTRFHTGKTVKYSALLHYGEDIEVSLFLSSDFATAVGKNQGII